MSFPFLLFWKFSNDANSHIVFASLFLFTRLSSPITNKSDRVHLNRVEVFHKSRRKPRNFRLSAIPILVIISFPKELRKLTYHTTPHIVTINIRSSLSPNQIFYLEQETAKKVDIGSYWFNRWKTNKIAFRSSPFLEVFLTNKKIDRVVITTYPYLSGVIWLNRNEQLSSTNGFLCLIVVLFLIWGWSPDLIFSMINLTDNRRCDQ